MKKLFGYKIGMQFNNSIYVLRDQNSYVTKILNAHIVLDLDNCVRTSYNSFTLKIFLFVATIVVKNSDYVYRGYGVLFDHAGLWSFGNDLARNVLIIGNWKDNI